MDLSEVGEVELPSLPFEVEPLSAHHAANPSGLEELFCHPAGGRIVEGEGRGRVDQDMCRHGDEEEPDARGGGAA